jgi:hypothetical protein
MSATTSLRRQVRNVSFVTESGSAMPKRMRYAVLAGTIAAVGLGVAVAPSASADPVHWDISGSTTIAKQNLTVQIP